MKIKMIQMALAIIIAGAAVNPAFAGFAQGSAVTMGGQPIFTILAADQGFSADHRAWLVQDKLDNALATARNISPSAVTVQRLNEAIVIMLDGQLIASVDAASAADENMTAEQLANKWADSIKGFLADKQKTDNYVATLRGNQPVGATIVAVQRTLFAPAGLVLPVVLTSSLTTDRLIAGTLVEATVSRDVPLGNYIIPQGTIAKGKLVAVNANHFNIVFTSLLAPNGTEMPIDAIADSNTVIIGNGPRLVCTQSMPAGMVIGMPNIAGRVAADCAIGAPEECATLIVYAGGPTFVAGQALSLTVETVTPVAVITRDTAM